MNKKFSTLMAAFLAAGAWTTASAEVVQIEKPTVGGTYLIGTDVDGTAGTVENLLQTSSLGTTNGVSEVIDNMANAFLLEPTNEEGEDGWFYLKAVGSNAGTYQNDYVVLVNNSGIKYVSYDGDSGNGGNKENAIKFKLSGKKLVVAEDVILASNSGIAFRAGWEVALTANDRFEVKLHGAKCTDLAFAVWNQDVNVLGSECELLDSFETDEYYLIAADDDNLLMEGPDGTLSTPKASTVSPDNVDSYLWKITTGVSAEGKTTYTFTNKKSGKDAIVNGRKNFIVEGSAPSFKLSLTAAEDQYLSGDLVAGVVTGAADFGVYKSPIVNVSKFTLNAILGSGFDMTIKKAEKDDTEIEGLDAFVGTLKAVTGDDKDANRFRLMNGDQYVVLDMTSNWSDDNTGSKDRGHKFVLVDKEKLTEKSGDELKYHSYFEFNAYAGNTQNEVVTVSVFADDDATDFGNLFIQSLNGENCLTTSVAKLAEGEKWPFIKLVSNNIVKPEDFLKKAFYTVTKIDEKEGNTMLAVTSCDVDVDPEFVESVGNALEAQWAITYDEKAATYTFKNREQVETEWVVNVNALREDDNTEDDIYVIGGDSYRIAAVENATESDGYMWLGDVENQRYAMGYYVNALDEGTYLWFVADKEGNISFEESTDASVATEMKFAGEFKDGKPVVDTIKVVSEITYYDATKKDFATADSVLKVPVYAFANVDGKNFGYNGKQYIFGATNAESLTIRMDDNDQYNLRLATKDAEGKAIFAKEKIYAGASADYLDKTNCVYDDTKNDLFTVEALNRPEYRRLGITVEDGLADLDVNTVKINRSNDENTYLYENSANRNANNGDPILNFLGETNLADQPENASLAIFVDTAYVRNETTEPLYLLSVRNSFVEGQEAVPCPDHGFDPDCPHWTPATPDHRVGAYLVGLADSTETVEQAMYQGNVRLAFVDATHVGDSLIIDNSKFTGDKKLAKNDTLSFVNAKGEQVENHATFSFRLVDPASTEGDFYIETVNNQYVRIHNSVPVLVSNLDEAATFNIAQTDEAATSNDEISTSEVKVIAGAGQITINGAAGKKVVVSNILGQVVANTVITSDNATIAAPQGIVVVAVEGEEAVKAIVK